MTRDNDENRTVPSPGQESDGPLEAAARRQFARLAEALDAQPQPIDLAERPSPRRAKDRWPVAALAAGAAAAVVGAAALWPSPDPTADVTVGQAVEGAACEPRIAEDGVIGEGGLPAGGEWAFRVGWERESLVGFRYLDGERRGGWGHDAASWPGVVNQGLLTGEITPMGGGSLIDLILPAGTASVDIHLADGTTVELCPATVVRPDPDAGPDAEPVAFAAGFLPAGDVVEDIYVVDPEGRRLAWVTDVVGATDEQRSVRADRSSGSPGLPHESRDETVGLWLDLDPTLVPLPLGGRSVSGYVHPLDTAVEVVGGETETGRWSLLAGTNGEEIAVELRGGGLSGGFGGTAEQVNDLAEINWTVSAADGGLVVWGPAPPEVTAVVVTLADGAAVPAPTTDAGVEGLALPVFAVAVPESAVVVGIEGIDDAGTVRYRADVVGLDRLATAGGGLDGVGLAIGPVG